MKLRSAALWAMRCLTVATVLAPRAASADTDLVIKTGGYVGTVTGTTSTSTGKSSAVTFTYGGIPVTVGVVNDRTGPWSLTAMYTLVTNINNREVIRQGADAGFLYHLLGGARRQTDDTASVTRTYKSPLSLSLVGLVGFDNYSASDPNDPTRAISGSAVELTMGLSLVRDVGTTDALGVELLTTIYSLPASTAQIKPDGIALNFIWRFAW